MSPKINPQIFREYDIRGIVGRDLTDEVARELGRGFGTYLKQHGGKRASIGYDARHSSPGFCQAMTEGMLSTGVDVVQIGLVPTPLLYFSLFELNVDGGVMITGSHNPPEFNGFKVALGHSTIYGDEIRTLRQIIESGSYESGTGRLTTRELIPTYIEMVRQRVGKFDRRLKVVVDAGNGTGGLTAPRLLRDLGAEVVELYCEVDGSFPNHHPDPTVPANLTDLIAKVAEEGADLGIAFDGDADRIGVIDEQGNIIWGDQLLILYSREVLTKQPGATIIFEVKCSQALPEEIEKAGGVPLMWKTGHSLIKEKMREVHAPLAGEMSGHIFFADEYYGYDDAVYAACRLVRLLSRSTKTISQMLSDVPRYYSTPETRVECPEEKKFQIVQELSRYFREKYETIDVDGVRILFGDGWGLVRASNTQPVLVLRFEAATPERLEEIKALVASKLREVAGIEI